MANINRMKILVYTPFRVGSSYICNSLKDENLKKVTFFKDFKEKRHCENILLKDHTDQDKLESLKQESFDLIITSLRKPTDIFISAYIKDFQSKGYPYYFDKQDFSVEELVEHFLSFKWEEFEWLSLEENLNQIKEISGVDFANEEFDKELGYKLVGNALLLTHNFVFNRKNEYDDLLNKLKPQKNESYKYFMFSNSRTTGDLYKQFKKEIPEEFYERYKNLDEAFDEKYGIKILSVDNSFPKEHSEKILDFSICENPLGKYCVPNSTIHQGVGKIVSKGVVYEGCTARFIRENCEGKDVIHAGCFFGDMLPAISTRANHVWAFEPSEENFRYSKITKIINNLENVTLFNKALGSEISEVEIQIENPSGEKMGGCSRIKTKQGGAKTQKVKQSTLDYEVFPLCKEVSIIHLDIEGCEEDALEGSLKIIDSYFPILILETINSQGYDESKIKKSEWVKENLFSRGYEIADFKGVMGDSGFTGRVHGNTVLCHPKRPWKRYFDQINPI